MRSRDTELSPSGCTRIAIVGIGLRLPGGACDPAGFWRLLRDGVDATTEIPSDRWNAQRLFHADPQMPGRINTTRGGFIEMPRAFDAQAFGISPREAARVDPQHRLILECAWEAIADAGLRRTELRGTNTSVHIGQCAGDFELLQMNDIDWIDISSATGSARAIASNRLSYLLDLHGASATVDTACSSSLVALHLACETLRRGESDFALAGGVNLILLPLFMSALSQLSMLAPDGRCKAFSANADGFGRGEGAGVLLLCPLEAALSRGLRVYATIAATAVNQDGRTAGITMPSRDAQVALVRQACAQAGIAPSEVTYAEAHGTGTPVGDPIEAGALGDALGAGRAADRRCVLGSVKTNIGHLEGGAGIAGVIKAALSIHFKQIPRSLHLSEPNPEIPFAQLGLELATEHRSWPEGKRIACVNSFGFGGTNAHALLEEAPTSDHRPAALARPHVLPLSARSEEGLRSLVARVREETLAGSDVDLEGLCATAWRREPLPFRRAVAGVTIEDLRSEFGTPVDSVPAVATPPEVVFVLCGQGPQRAAMGRELYETEPVFREAIDACDRHMRPHAPWSLREELLAEPARSRVESETQILQPTLFAIQVGLISLWQSWGVRPDAIVGHSMGEIAAAWASGALELADACRVIIQRGRIQQDADAAGRMMAVGDSLSSLQPLLDEFRGRVVVAAENSPTDVTLSGDRSALLEISERLNALGIFHRELAILCACHSHHMDPLRERLLASLEGLEARPGHTPHLSTVTGDVIDGRELGTDYWWRCFRDPVAFAPALRSLGGGVERIYLEIGPHPVLARAVATCLTQWGWSGTVLSSLQRNQSDGLWMRRTLSRLWELGVAVDWKAAIGDGVQVHLPHAPWNRVEHWAERPSRSVERLREPAHPLLGDKVQAPETTWTGLVSSDRQRWVLDHRVQGQVVMPAAAFVEAALASGGAQRRVALEDMAFHRALFLPPDEIFELHAQVSGKTEKLSIRTRSATQSSSIWTEHVSARVVTDDHPLLHAPESLDALKRRLTKTLSADQAYANAEAAGLNYGPVYRRLTSLWLGDSEILAHVRAFDTADETPGFRIHPAVLDACFQVLIATDKKVTYLPVRIASVRNTLDLRGDAFVYAKLHRSDERVVEADLWIFREDGHAAWQFRGLTCRPLDVRSTGGADRLIHHLYRWRWVDVDSDARLPSPTFIDAPAKLVAALGPSRDAFRELTCRDAWYAEAQPAVERLAFEFLVAAFVELGWSAKSGDIVNLEGLMEAWGIDARHQRRLASWLAILESERIVAKQGSEYRVLSALPAVAPMARWREVFWQHPECFAELTLLRRTGRRLAAVLTDESDALSVLFPSADDAVTGHVYRDAPTCRVFNLMIAEILRQITAKLPAGRPIRVLELGAGTGGLAAYALRALPNEANYLFTDISRAFLAVAETELGAVGPQLRTAVLDLDRPLDEQDGIELESADIVLAANCLHATRDLEKSLARARALLAPGGLLVLLETLRPTRWLDLVFGLTDQWWGFTDTERRQSSPLLDEAGWRDILRAVGFRDVELVTDAEPPHAAAQGVILSRRPFDATPSLEPEGSEPEATGDWLVVCDAGGVAHRVSDRLTRAGGRCVRLEAGKTSAGAAGTVPVATMDLAVALPEILGGMTNLRGVLVMRPVDGRDANWQEPVAATMRTLQALGTQPRRDFRTWVFTYTCDELGAAEHAVAQGGVLGLVRTAVSEYPTLKITTVSWDRHSSEADERTLLRELTQPSGLDEIAVRDGRLLARRIQPVPLSSLGPLRRRGVETTVVVDTESPGVLEGIKLIETARIVPANDEVEIEIRATALNFKDVMLAMGMLDPEAVEIGYRGKNLGMECAGYVTRVGKGVTHVKPGDRVVAVAAPSLAHHVRAASIMVARLEEHVSFEAAATVPVSFMTAWYALHELGRMKVGERLLIHSASGGLGLAALQLARAAGVEVIATAGTPEKRALLEALGVKHVFDSRSLSFVEEIRDVTGGEGVDLVLNSLAGEALVRSIDLLRPFGRFLEVGKRDFYADTPVGLRSMRRNLSFYAVDLDSGMGLEYFAQLFANLIEKLNRHELHPLPYWPFSLANIYDAFRFMAQGRHSGKLVLSVDGNARPQRARTQAQLCTEGAAVITGGFGGFGLALAQWLVERGVRDLVLVGRRGAESPEARAAVDELQHRGARVTVEAVDVSDPGAVEAVLERTRTRGVAIKHIFHAAMVLRDVPLAGLDLDDLAAVMRPKVDGAWNLHRATANDPLENFVLFSSISAAVGGPGQANYAAANTALAALAHYRQQRDMPALAVDWGALEGVGYISRHRDVEERLTRRGLHSFSAEEALWILGHLMQRSLAHLSVVDADWTNWFGGETPPRFEPLLRTSTEGETTSELSSVVDLILARPEEERCELVLSTLLEQTARVFAMAPGRLQPDTSLSDLGLDSLMAIELKNRVQSTFRVELPVAQLLRGPSLRELAESLSATLAGGKE